MCRTKLGMGVVVLLVLGIGLAAAQDRADIVVAGETVARVREKGRYESVEQRAAAIREAINEIIASEDVDTVEVSLKEVDTLWTVFAGDKRIMSVYPAEAEAHQMVPQALGIIWVNNLAAQLPKAAGEETGEPTAPAERTIEEPVTEEPVTGAVTNVGGGEVEVLEVPITTEAPPRITAIQGAKLLIVDAFNVVRQLDEDDYRTQRDGLAGNLLNNLVQVWTGGAESVEIEVPEVGVGRTEGIGPAPPVGVGELEVTDTGTGPADISDLISEEELHAGVPEGDANWANVPQKRRIQKKFELARDPFLELKARDPEEAAPVGEMLAAARKEFTAKEFDACEQHLDYALRMLGVIR